MIVNGITYLPRIDAYNVAFFWKDIDREYGALLKKRFPGFYDSMVDLYCTDELLQYYDKLQTKGCENANDRECLEAIETAFSSLNFFIENYEEFFLGPYCDEN